MAAPAAVLAVKAALVAATDKRARTAVLSVVAAVLTPFMLIIIVLLCAASGTANHNNAAVDMTFHGGYLSSKMPAEYRMYIERMRESFTDIDDVLVEINRMTEGDTVDDYRVKSIFYALFFGAEQPRLSHEDYRAFADCFVTYEKRKDEKGDIYTVAIPISDLQTVYVNLESTLNRTITLEDRTNAQRIYAQAKYGNAGIGGGGNGLPRRSFGKSSVRICGIELAKCILMEMEQRKILRQQLCIGRDPQNLEMFMHSMLLQKCG